MEAKNIPPTPCLGSLKLHAARATFQSFVWRNCLMAKPEIPSPLDHRWEMNENEPISIKWNTVKPAPEEILELMFCNCSKRCLCESCFCIQNGLLCTDACTKVDCENYWDVDITDGQDGEYTSDKDDYGEN